MITPVVNIISCDIQVLLRGDSDKVVPFNVVEIWTIIENSETMQL